jgi:UDP-N-acetylglucosamine transferase subunit ALG13
MRVFVTVGAQMPFDRLIAAMDPWAGEHGEHEVWAQIGRSELSPRHMRSSDFLSASEFERAYDDADLIVGHAGTGTIFAALQRSKPLLVLPRRAELRETRDDHQLATARRFEALAGVAVAWDERDLAERLTAREVRPPTLSLASEARGELVTSLASLLRAEPLKRSA